MKKILFVAVALASTFAHAEHASVLKGNSFACKPWPAKVDQLGDGAVVKCRVQANTTGLLQPGASLVGVFKGRGGAEGIRRVNWQHLVTTDGREVSLMESDESVFQSMATKNHGMLTVVAVRDFAISQEQ